MSKRHGLDRFTVKLAVCGIHSEKDPQAQQDFEEELSMRPHILQKTVAWDDQTQQLIIQLETEGIGVEMTAKGMTDELFEVACAVLNSVDGMHILILGVEQKQKLNQRSREKIRHVQN